MLRLNVLGLAGDSIMSRDGFERDDLYPSWQSKYAIYGLRFALAIGKWYPDVRGGYYANHALFDLISDCLQELNLVHVLDDLYPYNGIVPVEGRGVFLDGEDYALLDSHEQQVGSLKIWEYTAGGGGPFYKDKIIFDFVLPESLATPFKNSLQETCLQKRVSFEIAAAAAPAPMQSQSSYYHRFLALIRGLLTR